MIINFFFDFLLLLSVSIILRRNTNIYRILFGSFIGGLSILCLFINFTSLQLFIFKIFISIIMTLISFGYKNIKYTFRNLFFLYMASIVLGGFLYFLNIQFSYQQKGLIFFHNGLSINIVILIIFCPIILYIYCKQIKFLKTNYNHYYKIKMIFKEKTYNLTAFLDTGNKLTDIYTKKPIILIDKDIKPDNFFYIPYQGVNKSGLLKCFKIDKLEIEGKIFPKVIVGILENKIKIDGVECILHERIVEQL